MKSIVSPAESTARYAPKALIQQQRIMLGPTPDGNVIHSQATLRRDLFQIPVAKRIPQVPPHAKHDNDIRQSGAHGTALVGLGSIGRPLTRCWFTPARFQIPLSNRACRFPTHGLTIIFSVQLARDTSRCRAVCTSHALQLIPGEAWTFRGSLPAAPMLPAQQSRDHVRVHLFELPVGVPCVEQLNRLIHEANRTCLMESMKNFLVRLRLGPKQLRNEWPRTKRTPRIKQPARDYSKL